MRIVLMILAGLLGLILAVWLGDCDQCITNYLIIACAVLFGMVMSELLWGEYGA